MSAYRYLTAAGVYAAIMLFLYGKREACPREFFTKKAGNAFEPMLTAEKRKKTLELNFTKILADAGGAAKVGKVLKGERDE